MQTEVTDPNESALAAMQVMLSAARRRYESCPSPEVRQDDTLVPLELYENLILCGRQWSAAEELASLYEELRKPLLSVLTRMLQQSRPTSRVEAESTAQTDVRYLNHLRLMVQSRRAANVAKARMTSADRLIDMLRTVEANHRMTAGRAP